MLGFLSCFLPFARKIAGNISRFVLPPIPLRGQNTVHLYVREFENRTLLSWIPIGPSPQLDSKNILNQTGGAANGRVTGRISALAMPADNSNLILGAAGGGVWSSPNINNTNSPTWTTGTDNISQADLATGFGAGAIDVGAIAIDPRNSNNIYVGTGEANFSSDTRYGSGILKSCDGGTTFQLLSGGPVGDISHLPAFFRHAISKIIVDPNDSNTLYVAVLLSETRPLAVILIYGAIMGFIRAFLLMATGIGQSLRAASWGLMLTSVVRFQ